MNIDLGRPVSIAGIEGNGNSPPEEHASATAAGRLLSVSFLLRALRRRWKIWTVTAILGILIGAGISIAVPPRPSAVTTLDLTFPKGSDPARAMTDDITLIMTGPVARGAFARLGPSAADANLTYGASSISDHLMQITASASNVRNAVKLADAVAASFFAFQSDQLNQQNDSVAKALQVQQRTLNDQLNAVTAQIQALQPPAPAGQKAADTTSTTNGQLDDLIARRGIIDDNLAQIRQQIGSQAISAESVLAASSVIEPAVGATASKKRALLTNVGAGLLGGLALGAGWVLVWAVVSDRVRRREDVMAALHAPVAVSTGPLAASLRASRRSFRRHPSSPGPALSRIIRHLRTVVTSEDPAKRRLLVVTLDSDGPTAAALAHLAVQLSSDELRIVLADFTSESALARLLGAATDKTSTIELPGTKTGVQIVCPPHEPLIASDDRVSEFAALRDDAGVVLSVATLDPSVGAWHLSDWATVAVVVVTAGRSSEDQLRSASRMLRAAAFDVHSVVLIGADRNDETVGLPRSARLVAMKDLSHVSAS